MTNRPIDILLVEDSAGDAELIRQGLLKSKVLNTLHLATDGVDAISFMRSAEKPTPDLVMLDINLPRMNGHEVLEEMRSDSELNLIPVVILTTSDLDQDILRAYEHHASAYVQKPLNAAAFLTVVESIEHFWVSIVKLPPRLV